MCGRYRLFIPLDELIKRFGLKDGKIEFEPAEEIFPSDMVPVIINENTRQLKLFKWGFSPSFTRGLIINARAETIARKPLFKDAFVQRRCLIPATAFYEWKEINNRKIRYQISLPEQPLFSIAGIYQAFKDRKGEIVPSFTIITTAASDKVRSIHDRMPVILDQDQENNWLDPRLKDPENIGEILSSVRDKEFRFETGSNQLGFDF